MVCLQFCHDAGGEEGYKVVLEQILPVTASMLEDEKLEVPTVYILVYVIAMLFSI